MTEHTLEQQREKARIGLAAMFRLTAHYGWGDTAWNHIAARVPDENHHFYMHRFGLMYDEVTASNLIKVDEHGDVLEGPEDMNTAGFIIHSAIHMSEVHRDNRFVFHAHPKSAIAATAFKRLPFLVQDSSMLHGKVGFHDWEGLSVDPSERLRIADNMGENGCLVMRNHGFLTAGSTAGECFVNMYYLISLCEVALSATSSSYELDAGPTQLWQLASKQYEAFLPGKYEWLGLLRLCDRIDPSYKH